MFSLSKSPPSFRFDKSDLNIKLLQLCFCNDKLFFLISNLKFLVSTGIIPIIFQAFFFLFALKMVIPKEFHTTEKGDTYFLASG